MNSNPQTNDPRNGCNRDGDLANHQPEESSMAIGNFTPNTEAPGRFLLPFALQAHAAGLSVVPPKMDGTKAPLVSWKQYQKTRATEAQNREWYANGQTGLGIVTGAVSGNLECLEFDDKPIYLAFVQLAEECGLSDLVARIQEGYCEETPKPGIHLLYHCREIGSNTKLAKRPKTPKEMKHSKDSVQVLIETRGEGGYVITAPSHGKTHPTGKPYILVSGGFDTIATITPEERQDLFDLARSFDIPTTEAVPDSYQQKAGNEGAGLRPGDDFNARGDWRALLEGQGWTFCYTRNGCDYWRRPGKKHGVSACTNWQGKGYFYPFTTSTEFQSQKPYDKFGFYAKVAHGGDTKAAAEAVARQGYGDGNFREMARQGSAKSDRNPSESPWPDPEPLTIELLPVDPFDPDLLPESARAFVADVADRLQCPADYPAVACVIVLATVVGRQIAIRPKRRDDWTVVPNLWGGIIGRPSALKTPALSEFTRLIERLEARAREEYKEAETDYKASELLGEEVAKAKRKDIAAAIRDKEKSKDREALGNLARAAIEADESKGEAPARRRYLTNDATVEKLGELLSDNPRGLLIFRDELVGWLQNLDREGREGTRAFFLEAWNGTGRFTYDRIGRGTIEIDAACVSLLGGIQPGPLSAYVNSTNSGGAGDDGLLQRFQLLVWPDSSKNWRNVDRWPDSAARRGLWETVDRLDSIDPLAIGADREDPDGLSYLRFSEEAQGEFDNWRGVLEGRLRAGDLVPALEAHLAKYRSLIPSLALLFHLADHQEGGPVGLVSLLRACGWGAYLETHARRVYQGIGDPIQSAVRELDKHIQRGDLPERFTERDVYRKHWSLLTQETTRPALEYLADLSRVRLEPTTGRGDDRGRPQSPTWAVNPKLMARDAQ